LRHSPVFALCASASRHRSNEFLNEPVLLRPNRRNRRHGLKISKPPRPSFHGVAHSADDWRNDFVHPSDPHCQSRYLWCRERLEPAPCRCSGHETRRHEYIHEALHHIGMWPTPVAFYAITQLACSYCRSTIVQSQTLVRFHLGPLQGLAYRFLR